MLNRIDRAFELKMEREDKGPPVLLSLSTEKLPRLAAGLFSWFEMLPTRVVPDSDCVKEVIELLRQARDSGLEDINPIFKAIIHADRHIRDLTIARVLIGSEVSWNQFWMAKSWMCLDALTRLFGLMQVAMFDEDQDPEEIKACLTSGLIEAATLKAFLIVTMSDERFCLTNREAPFPGCDQMLNWIKTLPKSSQKTSDLISDLRYRLTSA